MVIEECVNDIYEAGLQNDKLNLLYIMNTTAQLAVKTPLGITERVTINNIVMQGTVWANMFCVVLLDRLGKLVYNDPKSLYYYEQEVAIPPLEMVDDVTAIHKCDPQSSCIK